MVFQHRLVGLVLTSQFISVFSQTQTIIITQDSSCLYPSLNLPSINAAYQLVSVNLGTGTDCTIDITGPAGSQLLLNFLELLITGEEPGCSNYVEISVVGDDQKVDPAWSKTRAITATSQFINSTDSSGKICGYQNFNRFLPSPYVTSSNTIRLRIYTGSTTIPDSFTLVVSPINADNTDVNQHVSCNGQALSSSLVCDNVNNCFDMSDETPTDGSLKSDLCPPQPFVTSAAEIVLWVFLGVGILLIGGLVFLFVKRRVQEMYLRKQLHEMEQRIMRDEGIERGDGDEVLKHDIFDLM